MRRGQFPDPEMNKEEGEAAFRHGVSLINRSTTTTPPSSLSSFDAWILHNFDGDSRRNKMKFSDGHGSTGPIKHIAAMCF